MPRSQESKRRELERVRRRGQERQDVLAQYKLERGCADCGYNEHAEALDFDHLDNKTVQVSHMYTYSWERIWTEVGECEVVCANCHRVRTAARRAPRKDPADATQ